MRVICCQVATVSVLFCVSCLRADDKPVELSFEFGKTFSARDSLNIGEESDPDAKACLDALTWKPHEFTVHCNKPTKRGEVLVQFPTPLPSGDEVNDRVAMDWFVCHDRQGRPVKAPAIVVVHEVGSNMAVGHLFARSLRLRGFHSFLMHLPYYGERRRGKWRPKSDSLFTAIKQAVADIRRSRDVVAALPYVDKTRIGLQGTSLGGFVSSTAAGLDDGYDAVFILLAGANLAQIIEDGGRDAAKIRRELADAGLVGQRLRDLVAPIEPIRIAHRINAKKTWLYSATYDQVVPLKHAMALAKAAKLSKDHHILMPTNHYTGIVFVPLVIKHIERQMRSD